MRTDEFDYDLPPELIAQTPIEPRDAARLLVIHRQTGVLEHRVFADLTDYLRPPDLLVCNDSRVIPARLRGRKASGGRVEVLLLTPRDARTWEALVRGKGLRPGARIVIEDAAGAPAVAATVVAETADGARLLAFDRELAPLLWAKCLCRLTSMSRWPTPNAIRRSMRAWPAQRRRRPLGCTSRRS